MCNKPRVTAVVLTCNRASYIREALAGVIGQTFPHWRLRFSDCSSDPQIRAEIRQVAEEHQRAHPDHETDFVQQPEPVPQSEHLRRALDGVETPYVALLDDDDVWLPNHLERSCRWLEENPRRGLTVSNGRIIDSESKLKGWTNSRENPLPEPTDQRGWLQLFLVSFFGSTSGFVFRREALAGHTFYPTSMVDIHLAISILLNDYQVMGFHEASYLYRVHAGSSYKKGEQVFEDRNKLRLWLFRHQGGRIALRYPFFPLMAMKSAAATLTSRSRG